MSTEQTLLYISIALISGLLLSRPAKWLKLPAVTGYLVAGILIGPFCLGLLKIDAIAFTSTQRVTSLSIISEVALGFIAYSIGNEFRLSQLKSNGKQATVIGIFQAIVATFFVDAALIAVAVTTNKITIASAITLGAIAAATAPAATLMVVRQYKAKGPLTDLLLPVVALDDAVGLVIFAVSYGIAKAITSGSIDIISIAVNPIIEIVASLLLGTVMGAVFTFLEKFFHSGSKRTALSIAFVVLTVAVSIQKFYIGGVTIGFSSLLSCMMLGTVFCNLCDYSEEIMERTDKWTAPLFVLFFVLSGAELELNVFADIAIVLIGIIYIIFRSIGKCVGAKLSSKWTNCSDIIQKYLGLTLLPQAGVALGMSIIVRDEFGEQGIIIRNIVLFGVLIYELFGPLITKISLLKAGEIEPEGATSARGKLTKPSVKAGLK